MYKSSAVFRDLEFYDHNTSRGTPVLLGLLIVLHAVRVCLNWLATTILNGALVPSRA